MGDGIERQKAATSWIMSRRWLGESLNMAQPPYPYSRRATPAVVDRDIALFCRLLSAAYVSCFVRIRPS